ncbi:MAG: metallophosphoesterase [Myxococcales bacterium]|nr:metallophosphoesterase [Myxococcales bacterium]
MRAHLRLMVLVVLWLVPLVSGCGSSSKSNDGDSAQTGDSVIRGDIQLDTDSGVGLDIVTPEDTSLPDDSSTQVDVAPVDLSTEDSPIGADISPDTSADVGASQKVVFVALGDFGTGGSGQLQVAAGIKSYCDQNRCDFILGLGDLIYDSGVSSVDDSQFQTKFETPYKNLDLVFYQSPGNHDYYGGAASISAMIAYTEKSTKWYMPSTYYAFTKAHVDFFSLDTYQSDNTTYYGDEIGWFKNALTTSKGTWRVAYGHYPLRSNGVHGDTTGRRAQFLRESLCGNVDIYFAGHDHNLEYLTDYCGVILVVSGAGGGTRTLASGGNQIAGFGDQLGFTVVTIEDDKLWFTFHDEDGTQLYKSPVRTKIKLDCGADGVCDGRCASDPDCSSQDCTAGNSCNIHCTMDVDCRSDCPCDFNKDICEPLEKGSTTRCACDPDCMNEDAAPCKKDGHCDSWCPTGTDPDC